ncbi:MAG: hypothetical protein U0414_42025 [Polyangiaceae bacterium]
MRSGIGAAGGPPDRGARISMPTGLASTPSSVAHAMKFGGIATRTA